MQNLVLYQAMHFWALRRRFAVALKPNAPILPRAAAVMVAAASLPQLWRSHAPVMECAGFDHSAFAARVNGGSDSVRSVWQAQLYPYPLWQYECRLLTAPEEVLRFDYAGFPENVGRRTVLNTIRRGVCDAVIIWVDWELDAVSRVSTGLDCWSGGYATGGGSGDAGSGGCGGGGPWKMNHYKQMVRFLPQPERLDPGSGRKVVVEAVFDARKFDLKIKAHIKAS
ncbi:unnamed protein product [Phaeothamnion confervicola]